MSRDRGFWPPATDDVPGLPTMKEQLRRNREYAEKADRARTEKPGRSWPERHARPTHPDTSHEAAAAMESKAPRMERIALRGLELCSPCTASELEDAVRNGGAYTELREGSLRKRLNDLREKGLAEVIGKRKCRVTGRTASVWRAIDSNVKDR